ncbi:hypothetical protein NDU88_004886 [Pleurodeles waltl]|uniref:Uncharacterized protein n=1 Tax=Pleurodeles waltl TaxID=8319 RepID=A0AAV7M8R6_PLEWA|nr:hypothetical protein NDU88_004886 [Pleurodeles waltl]
MGGAPGVIRGPPVPVLRRPRNPVSPRRPTPMRIRPTGRLQPGGGQTGLFHSSSLYATGGCYSQPCSAWGAATGASSVFSPALWLQSRLEPGGASPVPKSPPFSTAQWQGGDPGYSTVQRRSKESSRPFLPGPSAFVHLARPGHSRANEVCAGSSPLLTSFLGLRLVSPYHTPGEVVNLGAAFRFSSRTRHRPVPEHQRAGPGHGDQGSSDQLLLFTSRLLSVGGPRPAASTASARLSFATTYWCIQAGARSMAQNTPGGPGLDCHVGRKVGSKFKGHTDTSARQFASHRGRNCTGYLQGHPHSKGQNQGRQLSLADDRGVQSTLRVQLPS